MNRIKWFSVFLTTYLSVCFFFPNNIEANVQEACGISPKAIAMGNAFSAIADDFSAAYYNPAGLGQHNHHMLETNYLYCQPHLKQYLASNPKVVNADENLNFRSFVVGLVIDLARPINTRGHNLVLGLAITLGDNFKSGWRVHDWNPEVPRFIHYGDYMNRAHVYGGIGLEVIKEKLYVGGALNLSQDIGNEITVTVDPLQENTLSKEIDADIDSEISPIVGLLFKPFTWLSFGCTYRDGWEQKTPITLNTIMKIFGGPLNPMTVKLPAVDYYLPWNLTVGMAVTVIDSLICSFDVTHYHWSDFELPMWEGQIKKWKDTLLPRFGFEYTITNELVLRGGYYLERSPVPDQSDTLSNHLDFDKHVFSVGLGYTFINLPLIGELPFSYPVALNPFFQYQALNNRIQKKIPSVTNQSSWRIQGYQYAIGMGLTLGF